MGKLQLKHLAKTKKFSPKQIADYCKVSRSLVYMWLSNNREPSLEHLVRLSELFQVSIDELFAEK